MSRFLLILAAGLVSLPAWTQGISGVTRRTPAIERQLPARRFLDSAGVTNHPTRQPPLPYILQQQPVRVVPRDVRVNRHPAGGTRVPGRTNLASPSLLQTNHPPSRSSKTTPHAPR